MPFTFSHPAIILPLAYAPRRFFSMTGLIVGSMIPDFEYFMRMGIESKYSHSVLGVFTFDLPVALAFCFMFHCLIRNRLIENLPYAFKSRLLRFNQFDWLNHFKKSWHVIIISIVIGTASHIFWDSFTHPHRFFTNHIDTLREPIHVFGIGMHVYNLLQHLCSLVGLLIVYLAVIEQPVDASITPGMSNRYWTTVFSISILAFFVRLFTSGEFENIIHIIMVTVSAFLIALSLTPLLLQEENKKESKGYG